MKYVKCTHCKGKGHVLNKVCLAAVGLGWFLAVMERNARNGLSRDKCEECNGKGWVKL